MPQHPRKQPVNAIYIIYDGFTSVCFTAQEDGLPINLATTFSGEKYDATALQPSVLSRKAPAKDTASYKSTHPHNMTVPFRRAR
jgi:hypothetical protein